MVKSDVPSARAYRLIYPRPVVLVSCVDPETGKPNIVTVSWVTPLSIDPLLVGVLLTPKRHSHGLISRSKEFVVNVPTMDLLDKVVGCGKVSGDVHNKFAEFGLTPVHGKVVRTPAIGECVAHLECRLVDQVTTGDHTLFVGEVVAAYADEGAFDGEFIDIGRVQNICQVGGEVFATMDRKLVRPKP